LNDRQDVALFRRQKQGKEQVLDKVLTPAVAIQETYPEMSSVIWKKHETLFTTSLIFAQYASVDRSAYFSISRNGLEYFRQL